MRLNFAYVSENLQQKLFLYDPKMKQHSTQWVEKGGLPPKKARAQKSAAKGMVITFFYYKDMVYTYMVPHGTTVNANDYKGVLHQLTKDHIPRKRPEIKGKWKLHHDNSRPQWLML